MSKHKTGEQMSVLVKNPINILGISSTPTVDENSYILLEYALQPFNIMYVGK